MPQYNLSAETIIQMFPEGRNREMADMDRATLIMAEFGISEVDGALQVTKGGQRVVNPTNLNPIEPRQVIAEYFTSKGWVTAPKYDAGGLTTLSAFSKSYEQRTGKMAMGADFFTELNAHVKHVRNFDYYG